MMTLFERLLQGPWLYRLARIMILAYGKSALGLRIIDAHKVPRKGGVVVASNHITAWDPPLLGASTPREVNFMAKKELFERPWLRLLLRGLHAFPVDRERSDRTAIKSALRRLERGSAIGIFVQGTRSAGDAEALDGAAFLAQRAGVPLLPAAIWREGRNFRVRFGDPFTPCGRTRDDIRSTTDELMKSIKALMLS